MKLHSDRIGAGSHRVTAYGPGFVKINDTQYGGAVLLADDRVEIDLEERTPADLGSGAVERIRAMTPELVIVGTGAKHVFPPATVFASLLRDGIGVEIMATGAACRTFNIVSAEGRRVVALLLPIDASAA